VIAGLAYWLLVLAEGVYFGSRVVCMLYDWTAGRYEAIKRFDPYYERRLLGEPLATALQHFHHPMLLDVAAGTGRLARALISTGEFDGTIIALDRSRRMLKEGVRRSEGLGPYVTFIQGDAMRLPFADEAFEAVTCLEALEFMPDMRDALKEMIRVLKPGGLLTITNRKGGPRFYMPGHVTSPEALQASLMALGMRKANVARWQVDYDLVFARKSTEGVPVRSASGEGAK